MPLISVIMSIYNEKLVWIKGSVESILNQSISDFEYIIIIDNPKLDDDVNEYIRLVAEHDKRVKVIYNENNLGLTKSLNIGLSHATGAYIARMDADDIAMPQRLEKQLKFLIDRKLDLVGSNTEDIDESGKAIAGVTLYPHEHDRIVKRARYNSPLSHPTWLGRRKTFIELNGYQNIDACEDYDFLVRGILQGIKLGNIQENLLQYRINSSGISSTKKVVQKVSLYFIRENYRHGHKTSEEEYIRFRNSELGKRKQQALNSYYHKIEKMKLMKHNKIKKYLYIVYIMLSSNEAKLFAFNFIKEKFFVLCGWA